MIYMVLSSVLAILASAVPMPAQNADLEAGRRVYTRRCASCHGTNGEARPATARAYGVKMRHLGAPEVQALIDEQIRKLLKEGGMKAKPIRSLSDADVRNVIAYIRTFRREQN